MMVSRASTKAVLLHIPTRRKHARNMPLQFFPPCFTLQSKHHTNIPQGTNEDKPAYVAIKGTVFDVSKNKAYGPGGNYQVFAGKDPSRALALSSLKPEDCVPDWSDLEDSNKTVLEEWYTFFSKRYNIVGQVSTSSGDAKM
jgi:membrane-associated progesterone receptor component